MFRLWLILLLAILLSPIQAEERLELQWRIYVLSETGYKSLGGSWGDDPLAAIVRIRLSEQETPQLSLRIGRGGPRFTANPHPRAIEFLISQGEAHLLEESSQQIELGEAVMIGHEDFVTYRFPAQDGSLTEIPLPIGFKVRLEPLERTEEGLRTICQVQVDNVWKEVGQVQLDRRLFTERVTIETGGAVQLQQAVTSFDFIAKHPESQSDKPGRLQRILQEFPKAVEMRMDVRLVSLPR